MEFAGDGQADGLRIAICYWESVEAIKSWKANVEHREAQRLGRTEWYTRGQVRICKVEEDYGWGSEDEGH